MRLSNYTTGWSGLSAAQNGMQVAQQNISNANSTGYVRQTINYSSINYAGTNTRSGIGYGVEVSSVERMTNDRIQKTYNEQLAKTSYSLYQADVLAQAESLVSGSDISSGFADFKSSWNDLYKNPTDANAVHNVFSQGEVLSIQMNTLVNGLQDLKQNSAADIGIQVKETNKLLEQIAQVNAEIMNGGANTPNGLIDQRDNLVAQLSQYGPVEVAYDHGNTNVATVRINGMIAVSGDDYNQIYTTKDSTGNIDGYIIGAAGQDPKDMINPPKGQTLGLQSGLLGATLQTGKDYIEKYENQLNTLMNDITTAYNNGINALTPAPSKDFFTMNADGTVTVNKEIESELVAAFSNSDNFDKINDLNNIQADGTLQDKLDSFILNVSTDVNKSNSNVTTNQNLLSGIESSKSSMEGVNIDEELINITLYQNYFAANSKAISTLDKMFDSVLQML